MPGRKLTPDQREARREADYLHRAHHAPRLEDRISRACDYARAALRFLPQGIKEALVKDIVGYTIRMTQRAVKLSRKEDAT